MDALRDHKHWVSAVLSYRHDGLGARLMCMGNGLRLAQEFDCAFGFVWTMGAGIAQIAAPSDLFDVQAMAVKGANFTTFATEFGHSDNPRLIYADGNRKTIDMAAVPRGSTMLIMCPVAQRMNGESYGVVRKGLSKAMSLIVPAPAIAERLAAFVGEHDLGSAIGVHVRRGDIQNPTYALREKRLIELDQYFSMLDVNRTRDQEIFLCTEDASVIEAFEARYSKRVFRFPTRSWDRGDKEAVKDALIEILALARTTFVIGGPSSFGRAATGLGFIPLLTIANAPSGDPQNHLNAAQEFMKFQMLDEAALNLAACQLAPESEPLVTARRRLDLALTASKEDKSASHHTDATDRDTDDQRRLRAREGGSPRWP